MSRAQQIVKRMLEGDPDQFDAKAYFMSMAKPGDEPQVLERFREGVKLYIEWVLEGELMDERFERALVGAQTFDEVQAVLAHYETEPTFLEMVQQGYFV